MAVKVIIGVREQFQLAKFLLVFLQFDLEIIQ
jgi:hypothetical protein